MGIPRARSSVSKPRRVRNTAAKGRGIEWEIRDFLKARGYWTVRAAGSKGPFDLVSVGLLAVLLIQAKANHWPPPEERKVLEGLPCGTTAIKLIVRKDDGVGRRAAVWRWAQYVQHARGRIVEGAWYHTGWEDEATLPYVKGRARVKWRGYARN